MMSFHFLALVVVSYSSSLEILFGHLMFGALLGMYWWYGFVWFRFVLFRIQSSALYRQTLSMEAWNTYFSNNSLCCLASFLPSYADFSLL